MRGSGLLVACKFGCEDAAVREVQRALGELHGTNKIPLSTSAATLEDGNASDEQVPEEFQPENVEPTPHHNYVAARTAATSWRR